MGVLFRCICCGNPVDSSIDKLQCNNCLKEYTVANGVFQFSESKHYYSDLDREKMEALIRSSKTVGWRETITSSFSDNPFLFKIITDESRADWQYLLSINSEDAIALDLGAGWGTIAIPLARNMKHVVALDGTLDRLEFLSIRAKQEGINNLSVVHADIFQHPFQSEQFDVVSFNGVLEWVGVGGNIKEPKEKQKEALNIAFELLKPGGYLYIGIENAYGLKYLIGEPDDHTGIKYISYLSRSEANELSERFNKVDYQTYTYSKDGYQELLVNTGFSDISYYYPRPDYKQIETLNDLNHDNVSSYITESLRYSKHKDSNAERINDIERSLIKFSELSPFPASYSILARKEVSGR